MRVDAAIGHQKSIHFISSFSLARLTRDVDEGRKQNDAVGRTDVKFLLVVLERGNAAAEVVRGESSSLPKDDAHSLPPHDGSNNAIANSDLIWGGRDRREEEDSAQKFSQKNVLPCLGVPLPFYKRPRTRKVSGSVHSIHFETLPKKA